jgi:Kef-type K+ transport system membrane component KefB
MDWKPVYAILIFTSTIVTWVCGILLEQAENKKRKRLFLMISLFINFGILFISQIQQINVIL